MKLLLLLFLAVIGVNWPELPYGARLADLIFIPLACAVLMLPGPSWTWRGADAAVAIYLLGAIPAVIGSPNLRQSSVELARETYLASIYVVFALAAARGWATTIGIGLAAGGALLSITGLLFVTLHFIGGAPWPMMGEVMQLPYLGGTLRLRAFTASEAMLACVLTAAIPFALRGCAFDGVRARCWQASAIAAAAMLTVSHAIAGFAVAALIAAWPSLAARRPLRRAAAAAVIAIVLALNFAATISIRSVRYGNAGYADATQYHYAVDDRHVEIGGAAVDYSVISYARLKQVAWRTFVEHPIAGIGLDRFHSATIRAYEQGRLTASYREIDPHSALPGRLAETGIIGGITMLLLWIAWAGLARNAGASPIGYAALAALGGLAVSSINADIMNFRFVWVLAGLLRGLQDANGIAIASGGDTAAGLDSR